ncbi:MAG: DUF2812 domain-containing protein [Aminipila sp.]
MRRIFRSFNFGTLDYKDAERLLNDMAAKGYEFKGTGKGFIRNIAMFEKNEKAQNLKYAIDVGKRKEYEKETYYQFYRDLGWDKIDCFNNRLYIFATNSNNAVPLYADGISERNMRKKAAINNGELLDNIMQLVGMLIASSAFYFRWDELDNFIEYSFFLFFCLIMGCYAVQVAVKLIYIVKSWRHENQYLVSKTLQIIRWYGRLCWVGFFTFLPIASIIEFCYGEWTSNVVSGRFFGIIRWESLQLFLCIGSIPVIFTATYMLTLNPEKEQLKVLDCIGIFMYFWGLWCFLSYIL